MSNLNDQVKNFKKSLSANTMLGVKRVARPNTISSTSSESSTPKYGSINNNTRAAFEIGSDSPRKKSKKSSGTFFFRLKKKHRSIVEKKKKKEKYR